MHKEMMHKSIMHKYIKSFTIEDTTYSCALNARRLLFLFHIGFILFTELFLYFIYRDYSQSIDRLTIRLSKINILYVKIFQAFALNNSLIDEKTNDKLMRFTDNAPYTSSDIDLPTLYDVADKYNIQLQLQRSTNDRSEIIPMNSGMISLVFKGYERETKNPVVIKMKRKHIQQKLDKAIDNLLFSIYVLSFLPYINKYNVSEVIHKNIDMIRHQTDFLEEIENMAVIRNNCKHLKYVKIPTAKREVTETYPDVIMMDFISGIKINEIEECDYEGFAKQLVKFVIVTIMFHGVSHGDLHGGNLLFIKDTNDKKYPYKIGVFDFGIVYSLNDEYQLQLFDFISNLMKRPARESAEFFFKTKTFEPHDIFSKIPKDDYDTILSFTEKLLNEIICDSKNANQLQIYKLISILNDYMSSKLAHFGIRISDDFVKFQMVIAMLHGVAFTICKNDVFPVLDSVLNDMLTRV